METKSLHWLVSGESPSGEKVGIVVACSVVCNQALKRWEDAMLTLMFASMSNEGITYLASKKR